MSAKNSATPAQSRVDDTPKQPVPKPGKAAAGEYGREGTNKTIAEPKADNAPSEELGHTPHVSKTPYTRG